MRVGWLVDEPSAPGGAELTQAEFRAAAPEGVEVVDCPPGGIVTDCDRYVIQNCVQYTIDDLKRIKRRPIVKYWHDVGPWLQPDVRAWLNKYAVHVCCSPTQAEQMGLVAHLIPPPVDLDRFAEAAEHVNGSRSGACSVGSWRNYGKAPHKVAEWGAAHRVQVDYYGGGPLAPSGSQDVPYDAMPALLAQYETFVFLPTVLEPFGRVVAEAWAAGCEIVTNGLVGAAYWLDGDRVTGIENSGRDFWDLVTA